MNWEHPLSREERSRFFDEQAIPMIDSLYRTALRMTANSSSAEDLVQETLLKAYKYLHRFKPETNFRAWIFRIMTNTLINEYRKKVRAPRPMDLTEMDPSESYREGSYFTVDNISQFREHLSDASAKALEKVPEDFRLVFLLSTLEDFTYKEIADIVGIPVGTVMSRLFRARDILRSELREYATAEGLLDKGNGG
jgi:RNA polymerase sigma-70 factor (ECF subfamily)